MLEKPQPRTPLQWCHTEQKIDYETVLQTLYQLCEYVTKQV